MELQTFGWILAVWFAVSVVVSLALGMSLREVNASSDQSELDQVLSRRRVVRYMRGRQTGRKPAAAAGTSAVDKIDRRAH